ncbi:sel1 repeat family protein [Ectothiorhodospiraceae bacterium 2226]|nr:sel1 repeat family protein [Ectothiorhodospiraceae bacterium 2226]
MRFNILGGLVVVLALSLPAAAEDVLDAGYAAYRAGDYSAALAAWQPLAEQGHRKAQLYVGYMYRQGIGVSADPRQAARWYRKAAEQGVPEAQYQYALMLELGIGVEPDYWAAEGWYQQATSHGYCPSQLSAGGALGDR